MKKLILRKDLILDSADKRPGLKGQELLVQQDATGGHSITLKEGNDGVVTVGRKPGAVTLLSYRNDDVKSYWTSEILTPEVVLMPPSTITDLRVDLTDTFATRISWTSPRGYDNVADKPTDSFHLIINEGDIDPTYTYNTVKLTLTPDLPGIRASHIIADLEPGRTFHIAVLSEKISFGKSSVSKMSNIVRFTTLSLNGGEKDPPKRIALYKNKIYDPFIMTEFKHGERLTNNPTFSRLADQDYIIDNNGVPEGVPPISPVTSLFMYGLQSPEWYNVGMYEITFELDGLYDLDYCYILMGNPSKGYFKLYGSADGLNKFEMFDRIQTPLNGNDWQKIPLNKEKSKDVRYLIFATPERQIIIDGFVPYGKKKGTHSYTGVKHKRQSPVRTLDKRMGTNAFFGEENMDMMGKISSMTRYYNNPDWILSDPFKVKGSNQNATPGDIVLLMRLSHMWDFEAKMRDAIANGQEILFNLQYSPSYLRTVDVPSEDKVKPVDPGLDFKNLAVTTNPNSYTHISRIMFMLVGRLGFNTQIDKNLIRFAENDGAVGLGLARYFEFGNENEAHWKGEDGYWNAHEIAAILSAIYDGHMGTMGVGFGIKNADPNAKLLIPGMVNADHDFIRDMMLWWDHKRGQGNYPLDALNFHHYNNYEAEPYTAVYSDIPAWGLPPEHGSLIMELTAINEFRQVFMPNKELWCTEMGYDETLGGMIAPRDRTQNLRSKHKAAWLMRMHMVSDYCGIDITNQYWYGMDNIKLSDLAEDAFHREKFLTSGVVDGILAFNDWNRTPRIGWWYLSAFKKAMTGWSLSHVVVKAGENQILQNDVVKTYHPDLWVFAYKKGEETCLVAWLGTDEWKTFELLINVAAPESGIAVLRFDDQEIRKTEDPMMINTVPESDSSGKYIRTTVNEFPIIIKTGNIGIKKLIDPIDFRAAPISAAAVKLSWEDKNIGLNKTKIFSSTSPESGFTLIKTEYFDRAEAVVDGLEENTFYYFKIQFENGAELSDLSVDKAAKTFAVLEAPTDLSTVSATSSTITLSWYFPVVNERKVEKFVLYRSTELNGDYLGVTRLGKSERTYRDIGLVANTAYFYKIRTVNGPSISNFSFVHSSTTGAPNLLPPKVVSANTDSSGSYVDLTFDEELKDQSTAINAFTVVEMLSAGGYIVHTVYKVEAGIDKTKVKVFVQLTLFKSSTVTVAYDAGLGALKSVYNIAVSTFSNQSVANIISLDLSPVLEWRESSGITSTRNTYSGTADQSQGVFALILEAGGVGLIRMSLLPGVSSLFLGMDPESIPEAFNSLDYYIFRTDGVVDIKRLDVYMRETQQIELGIVQIRTDGTTIYFEVSYDNGLSFVTAKTSPQPNLKMYFKLYGGNGSKAVNLVHSGLILEYLSTIPDAPVVSGNNYSRMLTAYSPLGDSEIIMNVDNAPVNSPFLAYPGSINVGNAAVPAGRWMFKIKADGARRESELSFSPAFSESLIGGTPVIPSDWLEKELYLNIEGNNLWGNGNARSKLYLPAGSNGLIQGSGDLAILLDTDVAELKTFTDTPYGIKRNHAGDSVQIEACANGEKTPLGNTPRFVVERLRVDDTKVYFEYSLDNEISWISAHQLPRIAGNLYFKIGFGDGTDLVMNGLYYSGFLKVE
ncbi:fibronectin type III domain-containing protein [Pedobacter sp. FW305-3-2-15-E-R2A2]|uniref:fibronectin type III domain-containing protein n=1 Tax=Pedobacter sp. FW305-3-2-15-E-R2A2 TaxID=3140251 RepID=UPI0031407901